VARAVAFVQAPFVAAVRRVAAARR
jgi:hypothetical protein